MYEIWQCKLSNSYSLETLERQASVFKVIKCVIEELRLSLFIIYIIELLLINKKYFMSYCSKFCFSPFYQINVYASSHCTYYLNMLILITENFEFKIYINIYLKYILNIVPALLF